MGLVSLSLFQDEHSWVEERVDIHTSSTSRYLGSESIGIASARTTSFSENIGSKSLRFIDLFAGIGGFHLALHHQGAKCVFACEWDKYARETYEANFRSIEPDLFSKGLFAGDINLIDLNQIPPFDILCAGFPCQPFSVAGLRRGFEDARGTMFFRIAEIVQSQSNRGTPPKVLFLENVKGLLTHDKGNTLAVIYRILDELGYRVSHRVLNAKNFGIPQNRERIFIVAWLKTLPQEEFRFPLGLSQSGDFIFDPEDLALLVKPTKVANILLDEVDPKYTISERLYQGHLRRKQEHQKKGNGFGFSLVTPESNYTHTISARYYKDGSEILLEQENNRPRRLHPIEAGRLQGYPIGEGYNIVVSDAQAYKQFGNSVAVPVVRAVATEIVKQILS